MKMTTALCLAALMLVSQPKMAPAQAITNPTVATFTASADHANGVTSYTIGYFASGAASPTMEVDLGLPTPDAQQVCTVTLNVRPLLFGVAYTARVRALASTITSDWSLASNPFDRRPLPPPAPVLR